MERIPNKKVELECDLYWTRFRENQARENNNDYSFDACNLNDTAVASLEAAGVDVKTGEGDKSYKGRFVKCKSKIAEDRTNKRWFTVKMAGSTDLVDPETLSVGNGSRGFAKLSLKEWEYNDKTGVTCYFNSLMITELVEYKPDDDPWADHPSNVANN